jgi:hypothetical protein
MTTRLDLERCGRSSDADSIASPVDMSRGNVTTAASEGDAVG